METGWSVRQEEYQLRDFHVPRNALQREIGALKESPLKPIAYFVVTTGSVRVAAYSLFQYYRTLEERTVADVE
jgi:hypothetical protein